MSDHLKTGKIGEEMAAKFLIGKGFRVREAGWRHGRLEIDLIVENQEVVAFVEVKTRRSKTFGLPHLAVDEAKQDRIMDAAQAYVDHHEIDKDLRFDIVAVTLGDGQDEVVHWEEAF